jgi:hypothetical protein
LGMVCGERSENCLHIAIRFKLPPELTIELIKASTEEALQARDSKGFTPLHYAVEYERCTEAQFDVVQTIIQHGNSALDQLGNKPDSFSVYRYHESTREKYLKSKTQGAKRTTENQRERAQGTKDGEMKPPDGPISRPPKGHKELDPKSEASQKKGKENPKENSQPTKNEMKQKDGEETQRRESIFNQSAGTKDQSHQAQIGHRHGDLETLAIPGTPVRETPKNGMYFPSKIPSSKDGAEQSRRRREEAQFTEESAERIREALQLHYLRTRTPAVAARFLYGKNPKGMFTGSLAKAPTENDASRNTNLFRLFWSPVESGSR